MPLAVTVPVVVALKLSPDHAGTDLIRVEFRLVKMPDDGAVPQNRQRVADLHNFFQIMGDKEDCLAHIPVALHQIIQERPTMLGKRRGGFVYHQNFRVFPCDPCDLHKLPCLKVQRTQRKLAPDVLDAEVFQHLIRRRIQRLAVDRAQFPAEWLNFT